MQVSPEGALLLKAIDKADLSTREILREYRDGLGGPAGFAELQTILRNVVRSTIAFFSRTQKRLRELRSSVLAGAVRYDPQAEESIKQILRSWLALANLLVEEAQNEFRCGRIVVHPRLLRRLRSCLAEANALLALKSLFILHGLEPEKVARAIEELDEGKGLSLDAVLAGLDNPS